MAVGMLKHLRVQWIIFPKEITWSVDRVLCVKIFFAVLSILQRGLKATKEYDTVSVVQSCFSSCGSVQLGILIPWNFYAALQNDVTKSSWNKISDKIPTTRIKFSMQWDFCVC